MMVVQSMPVTCPECRAQNSLYDRFCGACGVQLARLRWRSAAGGAWQEGDGRMAITSGAIAVVHFSNHGVIPITLLLDERELHRQPSWIQVESLRGKPVFLAPGGSVQTIDLELNEDAAAAQGDVTLPDAELLFHSSGGARLLRLTLAMTRQPWAQPKASRYLYLPYECLRAGVDHQIEIHNAATEQIQLQEVTLSPGDPSPLPEGARQIATDSLVYWDDLDLPLTIEPGQVWLHPVHLRLHDPPDMLGFFSTKIRYGLQRQGETIEIESRLEGILGRGPTLEFVGTSTIDASAPSRETQDSFKIRNPGHVPVAIQSIEVAAKRGAATPYQEGDWLVLSGISPGDLLAPREEKSFGVGYDPDFRQQQELREARNKRVIRIGHDGWQKENERILEGEVFAHFGKAEERTLGIDFGTSNSVACLVGEETDEGYPLVLEYENNQPMKKLPSLVYFDGRADKQEAERFLYGEVAKSSHRREPSNLVRSIKTVVADGAKEIYEFKYKGADGGTRYLELPVQKLLNGFIKHLRSKAEQGVLYLDPATIIAEELNDKRVVFRNAVFSHPVEMTESMKSALWNAAKKSGINNHIQTVEQFFEDCCIDEATAAVLAYVDRLVADNKRKPDSRELKDLEHILCIDIGGGTTDLAAVSVANLATFVKNPRLQVRVELWSRKGDRHFAGDALDRLLALKILSKIEEQSLKTGSPILANEVKWAIQAISYSSYQRGFDERMRHDPRLQGILETTDAYSIHRHAATLLAEAERAKRVLSVEDTWDQTFSGSRWPRQKGADAAVEAMEFEVGLVRSDLEKIVKESLGQRFHLIDAVVKGAGWKWSTVTTLLLTGQTMYSPIVRQPIRDYVRQQMGETAERLFIAEPREANDSEGEGFDPKNCVAIGAALWGISRTRGGAWLEVSKPVLERLTFDVTTKSSRFFVPVPGLEVGAKIPAEGVVEFPAPRTSLVLYRDEKKFAEFRDFNPSTSIKIRLQSLVEIFIEVDGQLLPGDLSR